MKDLQWFVGFSNFHRRSVKDFSGIAGPLTASTATGVDITKGFKEKEALISFDKLHNLFATKPFLIHFNFTLPIYLHVDSLGYAYSGILSQRDADGDLRPVAYFSHKLNEAEKKWQVHDQELGAIVACLEE